MDDHTHDNDPRFVAYYANESLTEKAAQRADGIMKAVLRTRLQSGDRVDDLFVADIGCNAGTQSRCWLNQGHRVHGVDISRDLVDVAKKRNAEFGSKALFDVGSATALPWDSSQFDVCLLPELLEHVDDWQSCIREAVRVLRPGGHLFLSTTNVLCPIQNEFTLPLYSWYPGWLKAYYVKRALTVAPRLANFATYPAVHWFSPYGLKRCLESMSVHALDRFDLIDLSERTSAIRGIVMAVRAVPPLRFFAHVLTPSSIILGKKK